MGVEAAKGVRARQREAAARVERLIIRRDARVPIGSARRARIRSGFREVRRVLRARDAAQAEVEHAEAAAGAALARILAEGLSHSDVCAVLALSAGVGRRLIRSAKVRTRSPGSASSTDAPRASAGAAPAGHGQIGTATRGATAKGNP